MASIEVTVELSDDELAALDEAVSSGAFATRAEAFQQALASFLRRASSAELAASYRRAYRDIPEDERFAGVGLGLLADHLRAERTDGQVRQLDAGEVCLVGRSIRRVTVAAINRGDVLDAEVPGIGSHPVLVVSRQEAIFYRTRVTVAVVTSRIRGHVSEVPLDETHGLSHVSVADCNELYTIEKSALTRRRGRLDLPDLLRLDGALRVALGID